MEIEHPGVFVKETTVVSPRIDAVATATTGFVAAFGAGPLLEPTVVHSLAHFRQLFDVAGSATLGSVSVADFFAAGGEHAVIVRVGPESGATTTTDLIAALAALRPLAGELSPIQLLVMPDMARRAQPFASIDYQQLVQAATSFCIENRILLLIDPNTAGDDLSDINEWLEGNIGWGSTNSALYFPQLVTPAAEAAGFDSVPPSGTVAGVMARTDARRGVWKAPAGLEATVDATVPQTISDQEQSPLNRQGVNVIRQFPSVGTVIWGSRTGAGSVGDEFRYVPVRRTALFVENSLQHGLQWVVFEPNNEPLWLKVRHAVRNFLHDLWTQGGFVGAQADQAFFVRCDRSTMSRVDARRGRTIVQVGFAPLRPAEFVVITLTIDRRER